MSNTDSKTQLPATSAENTDTHPLRRGTGRSGLTIFLISFASYYVLFLAYLLFRTLVLTEQIAEGNVALIVAWELFYSFVFALPLAALAWLRIHVLRDAQGLLGIASMLIAVIGLAAFVYLAFIRINLPDASMGWHELPRSPIPLVKLAKTSSISALGGNLYGITADSQIYGFFCEYSIDCAWQKTDALPPPPDPKSYWSGTCHSESDYGALWLEPPSPGRVLDRLITHYCGPDYSIETHFLLTEDGNMWSLQKWGGMYDILVFFCGTPISIVIAILGTWWIRRLGKKAARP